VPSGDRAVRAWGSVGALLTTRALTEVAPFPCVRYVVYMTTSSPPSARYEVWRRDYDTFDSGEWRRVASVVHREVADAIVESAAGWGTEMEVRGGEPDERPEWADLTIEEFRERYAVIRGHVHSLDVPWVREYVGEEAKQRARAAERLRLYEAAQALPTKRGHPKGRIP
jgi:hypothetical protein